MIMALLIYTQTKCLMSNPSNSPIHKISLPRPREQPLIILIIIVFRRLIRLGSITRLSAICRLLIVVAIVLSLLKGFNSSSRFASLASVDYEDGEDYGKTDDCGAFDEAGHGFCPEFFVG